MLLHSCALGECSNSGIWKFRASSFKRYVDHSHIKYSSGNRYVRNWVHLFESCCIINWIVASCWTIIKFNMKMWQLRKTTPECTHSSTCSYCQWTSQKSTGTGPFKKLCGLSSPYPLKLNPWPIYWVSLSVHILTTISSSRIFLARCCILLVCKMTRFCQYEHRCHLIKIVTFL